MNLNGSEWIWAGSEVDLGWILGGSGVDLRSGLESGPNPALIRHFFVIPLQIPPEFGRAGWRARPPTEDILDPFLPLLEPYSVPLLGKYSDQCRISAGSVPDQCRINKF